MSDGDGESLRWDYVVGCDVWRMVRMVAITNVTDVEMMSRSVNE